MPDDTSPRGARAAAACTGRPTPERPAAFAAVAYAFAATMLGTTLPTPLYALYRRRFGLSELLITVIFATYAIGVIAALVLFGRLSDDIGRRRTLLPGVALSALSAVAFLCAHGVAHCSLAASCPAFRPASSPERPRRRWSTWPRVAPSAPR